MDENKKHDNAVGDEFAPEVIDVELAPTDAEQVVAETHGADMSDGKGAPAASEETAGSVSSSEQKKKRTKKIVGWAFTGLGIAVVAFLLFVVSVLAVDRFVNRSPVPSFFGISTLVVATGSMSGTIEEGDLIIVKNSDEYKIGDIVTFLGQGDDVPTTHRIIRIDGDKFFTKGDANNAEDPRAVLKEDMVGKVVGRVPYVGLFFSWLTEELGWLYLVAGLAVVASGIVLLKYFSQPKSKKEK